MNKISIPYLGTVEADVELRTLRPRTRMLAGLLGVGQTMRRTHSPVRQKRLRDFYEAQANSELGMPAGAWHWQRR
uniref:Uncharacterized protein n=1 Tax=Magnetococcus massalia (strain MO-1) TaxID=451514 RepID=A0A1S7LPY3_MAGMO|nr:protein of unknown function [Candidatus Magnetococcus massalia]CRH08312.1 protein of unknown function [Candidatus Magnetococcus massalia]